MSEQRSTRQLVEFYTIELARLADGTIHVSVTATTVDGQEPELLSQELANERVFSIDDALSTIRSGVVRAGGL